MARLILILLLMLLINLLAGCPRPLDSSDGTQVAIGNAGKPRASTDRNQAESPAEPTENPCGEEVAQDADTTDPDPESVLDADSVVTSDDDAGDLDTDDTESDPEASDESADESDDAELATDQDEETEIPDDEAAEDETIAVEQPVFDPQPPVLELSREARKFAGTYSVVAVTSNGLSKAAAENQLLVFSADGQYEGLDILEPGGSVKSGIWGMEDGQVTVSFGPAGEGVIDVSQADERVAVLSNPSGTQAWFCLKLPEDSTASSPAEKYQTDFGLLNVSRSGPGYWKGEYGDPPGTLVLQEQGGYLFGTWEQGSREGFVIFSLEARGFNGWWWYAGQQNFNGSWDGTITD